MEFDITTKSEYYAGKFPSPKRKEYKIVFIKQKAAARSQESKRDYIAKLNKSDFSFLFTDMKIKQDLEIPWKEM